MSLDYSSSDSEATEEPMFDFYSFLNKEEYFIDESELWRLSRGYSQCHRGIIVYTELYDEENFLIKFFRTANIDGAMRLITLKSCVVKDPTLIFLLFSCVYRGVFETVKTIFSEDSISELYYPNYRLFFESDEGRLYIDESKQSLEETAAWVLFRDHLDCNEEGLYGFTLHE